MTAALSETNRTAKRRPWPALLHRVVGTVRSEGLFQKGQHLLVALSGGPDSVTLLSLVCRLRSSWQLTVTAVHCNYGLRGKESEEDQAFVVALCRDFHVPLYTRRLDVSHRARRTSLQEAARELRYAVLLQTAKECSAHHIAVGHTADDQAETVLLWMLRGAGLTGLSGMPVSREGTIIRPLLQVTRDQVLDYLKQEQLSYRHDSSNDKLLYRRNRVRHQVLPSLTQISSSSVQALCRLAELCREDDRYLHDAAIQLVHRHTRQGREGWEVDRVVVQQLPLAMQRRLLRELLRRVHPSGKAPAARVVERILRSMTSSRTASSVLLKGARVTVTANVIRFLPAASDDGGVLSPEPLETGGQVLTIPSEMVWAATNECIRVEERGRADIGSMAPGPRQIIVDAERLSTPLMVRSWRAGDRFYPLGMKGRSKKLQDYFTDVKIPAAARRKIPLVVAQEGIVWVVGYRQDERWAVTERTRHCLVLTARHASQGEGVS